MYAVVDLGGRAMLVRSAIGGGLTKVADCRTVAGAKQLCGELNTVTRDMFHVDDIQKALMLLEDGKSAEIIAHALGIEEEE